MVLYRDSFHDVHVNITEIMRGSSRVYSANDHDTKIEIGRDVFGNLYIYNFFANRPNSVYYDSAKPRTPKDIPKKLLCAILNYILFQNKDKKTPTTEFSKIQLFAESSSGGGDNKKLVEDVYEPMGFEIYYTNTDMIDDTEVDWGSGVQLSTNVKSLLDFCKNPQKWGKKKEKKRSRNRSRSRSRSRSRRALKVGQKKKRNSRMKSRGKSRIKSREIGKGDQLRGRRALGEGRGKR